MFFKVVLNIHINQIWLWARTYQSCWEPGDWSMVFHFYWHIVYISFNGGELRLLSLIHWQGERVPCCCWSFWTLWLVDLNCLMLIHRLQICATFTLSSSQVTIPLWSLATTTLSHAQESFKFLVLSFSTTKSTDVCLEILGMRFSFALYRLQVMFRAAVKLPLFTASGTFTSVTFILLSNS